MAMALTFGLVLTESETALHARTSFVPRLIPAPPSFDGLVRLHFHARGAISNLFIEPQPAMPPLSDVEVLLRVDGWPVLMRQDNVLASTFHPELGDDTRLHALLLR